MRVLFVVNTLSIGGGMEVVSINKMNSFVARPGLEIACAFQDRRVFPQPQLTLSEKVKLFDLQAPEDKSAGSVFIKLRKTLSRFLTLRKRLKKVIADWKPDIVISVGLFEYYVIPTFFKRVGGCRFKTLREYHFLSNYRSVIGLGRAHAAITTWIEQRLVPRFYDANCLLTYEDLEKNFPAGSRRMRVVPNPITCNVPDANPSMAERDNVCVFAGRLVDQKNPEALVEAWSKVERRGWKLRILGDGILKEKLQALVKEKGLEDSVELPGWCENVSEEFIKSKVFLFTSRYEGFGLALLEAMANGVVPVSFECPYGPRDIITDGKDGFLIPDRDTDLMARRIQRLIDDGDLLQRMSESAFLRSKDFSIDRITDRWIEEYRRLLEK